MHQARSSKMKTCLGKFLRMLVSTESQSLIEIQGESPPNRVCPTVCPSKALHHTRLFFEDTS